MKDEIKKRIVMLGVLLLAGLVLAGIGNVLGAGELVQETISKLAVKEKIVLGGNQATIYENGKIIDTIPLKEIQKGEETPDSPINEIMLNRTYLRNVTKEKWLEMNEGVQAELNKTRNEFFEIARKDKRVQELIEGKEYLVDGYSASKHETTDENNTRYQLYLVTLYLEVEGEWYEITLDSNSETVISVKSTGSTEVRSDPDVEVLNSGIEQPNEMTDEEKKEMEKTIEKMEKARMPFFEIARKDPRVQELIEGKNYSTHGMGRYTNPMGDELIDIVTLDLRVEGKEYKISIDMTNETVRFVDEKDVLDKKAFEIAGKDIRVQELIEGKECYFPYAYGNGNTLGELIEEKECLILDAKREDANTVSLLMNIGEGEMSMGDRMHVIYIDMNNETVTAIH